MNDITFSGSFLKFAGEKLGIRRRHVIEAIKDPDMVQTIVSDEKEKLMIFTKYIEVVEPHFTLVIIAREKKGLEITEAFKIYPTLSSGVKINEPLVFLKLLSDKYGFKITIGDCKKLFFHNDKINTKLLPTHKPFPFPFVLDNPKNRNYLSMMHFRLDDGLVSCVEVALCFCIDTTSYLEWVRNKGVFSYFQQEALRVKAFTEEHIVPAVEREGFRGKVFKSIHDFCFYCRQHPSVLNVLPEEQIRDLYLIVIKTIFTSAEGEPFHYDGKLDFKIINPENKYEIISGELKWWRGNASAEEVFHQAVRKHATGQELEIYCIMLNKNKDARAVFDETIKLFATQPETRSESFVSTIPTGSKEMFGKYSVVIRGNEIPLYLGIGDLFYEKM